MSNQVLRELCDKIDNLTKKDHIDILYIIKTSQSKVPVSENGNGCFVNMSTLNEDVVQEIKHHVEFCITKEDALKTRENEKNHILNNLH